MPTLWDGRRWSKGKPNPVTLVATVVARKRTVHTSNRFPATRPNITTRPAKIPTRLNTTCTRVNVEVDRPQIMMFLRSIRPMLCRADSEGAIPPSRHPPGETTRYPARDVRSIGGVLRRVGRRQRGLLVEQHEGVKEAPDEGAVREQANVAEHQRLTDDDRGHREIHGIANVSVQ